MEPICVKLPEIRCNFEGFSRLADLYSNLRQEALESVLIDCSGTNWFHANMSAPFGVILDHIASLNHVRPFNFPSKVEHILRRNNFLVGYRYEKMQDIYHTAIPYQRFAISDHNSFALHIAEHLQPSYVPEMSAELKNRFVQSIHEIFANSAMHSETSHGIHVCGQFFPTNKTVDLCIADAGIGIRNKVAKELGLRLNSDAAIEWALEEGNTTKKGKVPGGLGLKLLREFITLNKGRLQIVSNRGYWELANGKVSLMRMEKSFPGTVINIEINTSDTKSYKLSSET